MQSGWVRFFNIHSLIVIANTIIFYSPFVLKAWLVSFWINENSAEDSNHLAKMRLLEPGTFLGRVGDMSRK